MPRPRLLPPAALLWELFDYQVLTGKLIRRTGKYAEQVAGHTNCKGYCKVKIQKQVYSAHRLIWVWCVGDEPDGAIDHVGQELINPKQDHIWNLEVVSLAENNKRYNDKVRPASRLPHTSRRGSKWVAYGKKSGKTVYLGAYGTQEEAYAAYCQWLNGTNFVPRKKSSTHVGVYKQAASGRWVASYKRRYIGIFTTEQEAIDAIQAYRTQVT